MAGLIKRSGSPRGCGLTNGRSHRNAPPSCRPTRYFAHGPAGTLPMASHGKRPSPDPKVKNNNTPSSLPPSRRLRIRHADTEAIQSPPPGITAVTKCRPPSGAMRFRIRRTDFPAGPGQAYRGLLLSVVEICFSTLRLITFSSQPQVF